MDEQRRLIAGTFKTAQGDIRTICGYFPNGAEVGCDKYAYKLAWLGKLQTFVKEELQKYDQLALLGDYNIAPDYRDVWNPKAWEGNILVSPAERGAFQALLKLGFKLTLSVYLINPKVFIPGGIIEC